MESFLLWRKSPRVIKIVSHKTCNVTRQRIDRESPALPSLSSSTEICPPLADREFAECAGEVPRARALNIRFGARLLQFRDYSRPRSLSNNDVIDRHCAILSRSYRIKSPPRAAPSKR